MFEHRSAPLLPRREFIGRMRRSIYCSTALIAASLGIGMLGYHWLEKMSWVDSFANASMILAGMGPLGNLQTDAGKIFAGIYALFCGLIFVSALGIIIAPMAHRALHQFHLETGREKNS